MRPQEAFRILTDEEIEHYRRDGAICVRGLYSRDWIARLEEGFAALLAQPAPDVAAAGKRTMAAAYTWMTNDSIRDFVLHGPSAKLAQQVFGSERVNFFHDLVVIKLSLGEEPTPWHHDAPYWPIEGDQVASLWTSIDAVDADSSALQFVAGSHRWGKLYHPVGLNGESASLEKLEPMPDIDADPDQYKVLCWDLEPGDALLFHGRTIHGARSNTSPHIQRRAISTRWCGDDVRYGDDVARWFPFFWPHDLKQGDTLSGPLFPQVLPEWDLQALAQRLEHAIPPDPAMIELAKQKFAKAERASENV